MTSPTVSVIIATLGGRHLDRCLATLAQQTGVDFEVIVIDGGDRADVAARVARWFRMRRPDESSSSAMGDTGENRAAGPPATVVKLPRNLGFAGSNNVGLRLARGRWLATLNDDAFPDPDWLARLVEFGEREPGVGACASLMVWADRPAEINSTGIALNLAGVVWDRRGGEPVDQAETEPTEVFGACAGAALYRAAALAQVGLFDEPFFAYLEDVDLAWRLRWAGWRTLFTPTARVLHQGSQTSDRFPRRKEWLLSRNRVYVLARNYDAAALLWLWPLIALYDLLSVPWWRIRYQRDFTPLLGRLAGLRQLPRLLVARRRLPPHVVTFASFRPILEPLPSPLAFARGAR